MGANGTDLEAALTKYMAALGKSDIQPEPDTPDTPDTPDEPDTPDTPVQGDGTVTGTVADIRTAVKSGESYYYIKLDAGDSYYVISASKDENVVILNKGDSVTVSFSGEGAIIKADSITIN